METDYRTSPIRKNLFKMLECSLVNWSMTKGIQENLGGVSQVTQEMIMIH